MGDEVDVTTMPNGEQVAVAHAPEPVETKPEGEIPAKEPEKQPWEAKIEAIEQQNAQLREIAQKSQRDSEAAQAYVAELIGRIQQAAQNAPPQNSDGTPVDMSEALQQNPQAVLDAHFAQRMNPLIAQSLDYQVQTAKELFEQKYASDEDFQAYGKELDEFMNGIPAQVKAQPKAWENGLDFIRAKHLNEIVQRRQKKLQEQDRKAFLESPSPESSRRESPVRLSGDQKAIAKGLGLSEDEYIKWMGQP